jgi:eukaryotic-like serine/threonine-protein kinase
MLLSMTSDVPGNDGRLLDNRYRLGSLLGVGGVASVYRAIDERLHRGVAIKLFRGDVADQLQRHEEEMRTLARLNHASLVTVFDAGTDEPTGQPYLVMALVEGSTLATQLQAGPLTPQRTAEIGASVADALAYVHGQGLVHRDVKPANVLISSAGRVFLADFGIARLVDSAHVTQAGDVLGTPSYFAPEQVTGGPVGPPADVYALGLVLLECLTGDREYDGTSMEAAMARLHRQPVIPPVLPAAWRDLLAGMTALEPASRLSAAQAEERLRRLADGDDRTVAMQVPLAATQVIPAVDPTIAAPPATDVAAAGASKKRPWIWVLVVCLLIIAAAGTAVALTNRHNSNNSPTQPCGAGTTGLTGTLQQDMANLNTVACPAGVSSKTSAALHPLLDGMRQAATGTSRAEMNTAYTALLAGVSTLVTQGQVTVDHEVAIQNAAGILKTDFLHLNPPVTPTSTPPTTPTTEPPTTPTTTPPTTPTTTPPTTPTTTPPTTPPTTPTTATAGKSTGAAATTS